MAELIQEDPPTFDKSPAELIGLAEDAATSLKASIKALKASISPVEATFINAVRVLADIENRVLGIADYIALFQSVSPDVEVRKAATKAFDIVIQAHFSLFRDEDLFALVKTVSQRPKDESLDDEDARLLEKYFNDFVDNGLGLHSQERARFATIVDKWTGLRNEFIGNLSNDPGFILKSDSDLSGLSSTTLERLAQDSITGLRRIDLRKSIVTSVLTECDNASTRRHTYLAFDKIHHENKALFKEIVVLRDEGARMLGHASFAEQGLRSKMIGSSVAVDNLVEDLRNKLQPLAAAELELLSERSQSNQTLHLWDFDYYHNLILKEQHNIDHAAISEYFPAEVTLRRMLDIFEEIFGLTITELQHKEEKHTWHPDVTVYTVHDSDSTSIFHGYLYTDIYPRPGKFNHNANFTIYPSYLTPEGKRTIPATALICNISLSPTSTKPSLVTHRELITIFHELGHGMHDLLGRSRYARLHGHRTVRDFVEAPSQLLEYWCWNSDVLKRLSCHYTYLRKADDEEDVKDSSDPEKPPQQIPQQTIQNLIAAKSKNQAILTLRQLAFSTFDMRVHNPSSHNEIVTMDIDHVFNSTLVEYTGLQGTENDAEGGHNYATSSHWTWGQEGCYYSYIYTRFLAADIFHTIFAADPMGKEAGMRYRRLILERGGSRDETRNLVELLGREVSGDAYLKDLGVFL